VIWLEAVLDLVMAITLLLVAVWVGRGRLIQARLSRCICHDDSWSRPFSRGLAVLLACAGAGLAFGGLSHVSEFGKTTHAFLGPPTLVGVFVGCYLIWVSVHE